MGYMKSIYTECLIELNSFTTLTLNKLEEIIEDNIKKWQQSNTPYDLYKYQMLVKELYQLYVELQDIFIQHSCINVR